MQQFTLFATIALTFILFIAAVAPAVVTRQVPINPVPASDEVPGNPPYELTWSARGELPVPQVTFDNLTGWTLAVTGDAEISMHATVARRIWRDSTAVLSYANGTQPTTAIIRPPAPVVINEPFDSAGAWVYGGWYRRATADEKPPFLTILLEDAKGKPYRIPMGAVLSGNWSLEQGILSRADLAAATFPMQFTGLEVADLEFPQGASDICLENIHFYKQSRNPSAWPFKLLNPGLPTTDAGMLPTTPPNVSTTVEMADEGARFTSESPDGRLIFDVRPAAGFLDGISAQWNGGKPFQPAAGGSLNFEIDGEKVAIATSRKPVTHAIGNDSYRVTWNDESTGTAITYTATYRLSGRTLIIDISCNDRMATGLDPGAVAGLSNARGIFVPYMAMNRISHLHTDGPLVACADDVFVSVLPDFYHSDFSSFDNTPDESKEDRIRLLTGTSYLPLTDGIRNPLRERLLVSVSPEFHDVLPNARNPSSPNREKLSNQMLFMAFYPYYELFGTLNRIGVGHVTVLDFASMYQVEGHEGLASFSSRWRPLPGIAIQQFQDYGKYIRSLGYQFGVYNFFTDIHPVSQWWDESKIALKPDGSLAVGWWYGDYAVKMNAASRVVAAVGPLVKELYAPDATYLDIQSVIGLDAMDYEAGVEGAGISRYNVLGNADAMMEARKHYGITISEGYHRWLYAGAVDADYATMLFPPRYKSAAEVPPLVDFDLLKIHPFQHGVMMSFQPQYYLDEAGPEWVALVQDPGTGQPPIGFYKYLSASLAYGHMAMLGYDYLPPANRMMQLYAMMQGVQKEYLTDEVADIAYHDGSQFLSTSNALRANAIEHRRVRVTYKRGLTVHANLHDTNTWTVEVNGKTYELPPHGWVIEKPGEILSFSANFDGHRIDGLTCPEYTYLNTGDHQLKLEQWGIELKGAALLKRQENTLRVTPCGNFGKWQKLHPDGWPELFFDFRLLEIPADRGMPLLKLNTSHWIQKPASDVQVTSFGEDIDDGKPVSIEADGDWVELRGETTAIDYLLK